MFYHFSAKPEKFVFIFYNFSTLGWHKCLKCVLVDDRDSFISHRQCHVWQWRGEAISPGISSHGIDLLTSECSRCSTGTGCVSFRNRELTKIKTLPLIMFFFCIMKLISIVDSLCDYTKYEISKIPYISLEKSSILAFPLFGFFGDLPYHSCLMKHLLQVDFKWQFCPASSAHGEM